MIDITDKFHTQIDALIQLHNDYRDTLPESVEQSLSPSEFAIEFGTVKCDIGRRVGKTKYVKRRANAKTLVVVPKKDMADEYRGLPIDVLSARQVADGKAGDREAYETVFIEEPTFVFRSVPAEEIYRQLALPGVRQVFVQLGA